MNPLGEMRKFLVLYFLTVRRLLTAKRGIATGVLATAPLMVTLGLALGRVQGLDVLLLQAFAIPLEFQVVIVFVTLVYAIALVREEIEDETLVYLLLRPLRRPALVLYEFLGYFTVTLILLLPPLILSYGATEAYSGQPPGADADVLGALVASAALGAGAYGSIFLVLSLPVRRPLWAGLLFGFVWESIVGGLPGNVPRLSVIHYTRSIIKGMVAVGPLSNYNTDVGPGAAAAVLLGITVGGVALAMVLIRGMEFKQKA